MAEYYWISKKGLKNLENQYEAILKEEIETQRKIGESVKMDNDLRENPDYMQLQTKAMTELKYKLNKTREVMNSCRVIEESSHYQNFDEGIVSIGSKVTIEFDDEDFEDFTILGYGESDLDENIISYLSPLGQALLNRRQGESFIFENDSFTQKIRIIKIVKGIF